MNTSIWLSAVILFGHASWSASSHAQSVESLRDHPIGATNASPSINHVRSVTADSVSIAFSTGVLKTTLASVNGVLYADDCDSVRVLQLIFTWGQNAPPFQVPDLNWKAGRHQNAQANFPLPPAAPGFPKDAHLVFVVYPGGTPQARDIDPLEAGVFYKLAESCTKSGVDDESGLPQEFSLAQNYPNPFNPITVVSFQLPVASNVRLLVCDLLGREVSTLVNENKPAGVHTAQFDASNLASGVYVYRLKAGSFVAAKKMVLAK